MPTVIAKYKKPLLSGMVAGLGILVLLLMLSDLQGVIRALASFKLSFLPIVLILAPLNYILRYVKWNYYLRLAAIRPHPKMNGLIFLSGLSMTITPGKLGELLKCYLLKEHLGTPLSVTASIVMAERLSDAMAMLILAALGSLAYAYGRYVLLLTAAFLTAALALFHYDVLFRYAGVLLGKIKLLRGCAAFLLEFQQSARKLFTLPSLLFAVTIGVISWGLEGLVIFFAVKAFGGDISILGSIFTVSFSSLLGALCVLPGGFGVAEGSIMALLLLIGLGKETAAATTLVTRFSTLWLGVLCGLLGLYLVQKELLKAGGKGGNLQLEKTGEERL